LGCKLVLNSVVTSLTRGAKKAYSSSEDCKAFGGAEKPNTNDETVERIRRMHQNDIENYVPFFLLSTLYVLSDPNLTEAKILIWVSAASLLNACLNNMEIIANFTVNCYDLNKIIIIFFFRLLLPFVWVTLHHIYFLSISLEDFFYFWVEVWLIFLWALGSSVTYFKTFFCTN